MKFKASIKLIDLDIRAYKKELDAHMTETVRGAARSWLRTVLTIIPTWSRASRATFEELANKVGFNITYGPIQSKKDRLVLGLSTGKGGLDLKRTSWHFFYETDLRYLAYNELNRVVFGRAPNVFSRSGLTNPTPYRFQEAGAEDFKSLSQNVLLPNPFDFIKGRKI